MSCATQARAQFTPTGRLKLVQLVVDEGWAQARVAERFQCTRSTVSKWVARYRLHGRAGLFDHSSRPHRSPNRLPQRTQRRILALRFTRQWGPHRIAYHPHLSQSTTVGYLAHPLRSSLHWSQRRFDRLAASRINLSNTGALVSGGAGRSRRRARSSAIVTRPARVIATRRIRALAANPMPASGLGGADTAIESPPAAKTETPISTDNDRRARRKGDDPCRSDVRAPVTGAPERG